MESLKNIYKKILMYMLNWAQPPEELVVSCWAITLDILFKQLMEYKFSIKLLEWNSLLCQMASLQLQH